MEVLFPEVSKRWHKSKNGSLRPDEIKPGSAKKIWWVCEEGHEYLRKVYAEVNFSKCFTCATFGHAKPQFLKQWHPTKNDISPYQIGANSSKKVWWLCKVGHEFEMNIRTRKKLDFCPICDGKGVILDNSLLTKYPKIAREWNYKKNENLYPSEIKPYSSKKVWWVCEKGHEWQNVIRNRTRHNRQCLKCKNLK